MSTGNEWLPRVQKLIREAERNEARGDWVKAVERYEQALERIPDPKEESVYATRLYVAIGEAYWLNKDYQRAYDYFNEAVRCKGGLGYPQIHLRLGQLRYEFGEMDRARDELMRAYMGSGTVIFEGEDPKYYNLIKDIVEKPHA